jgi:hypothetical protein
MAELDMEHDVTRIPDHRIEIRPHLAAKAPDIWRGYLIFQVARYRGGTADEAIMGVQQAIAEWIAAALDRGEPIPNPTS